MQVLPGVYLVNGSPYGRHQNGYLVATANARILIDSGDIDQRETLPEVERNARRWGFDLADVSHLFVTHAHFDHASHAAALQRRGHRVVASRSTAEAMAAGDDRCIGYAVHRAFEPCVVDDVIEDSLQVGGLTVRALPTPGHAEGHVVYEVEWNDERLWFTGDLFEARHSHRGIDLPWTGDPQFSRAKYIESLARLRSLQAPDHILPGHGPAGICQGRYLLNEAYSEALRKWR
jgi:glyoxylase-like metal-dependent hydrolase (beta-lactamase superfamily II)